MNPITALSKLIKSKKPVEEIERDVKTMTKINWKTTILGIVSAVIAMATIWAPSSYQPRIAATATALASLGLIAAKDHDK